MLFVTILTVAVRSLLANKLRSILAMLGIIIGVASVVSMLALGTGAEAQIMERFEAMGTNLLVVRPGSSGSRGVSGGTQTTLTLQDSEAILREVEGIAYAAPVVRNRAQFKYAERNTSSTVLGSSVTYLGVRNFKIARGRAFTEAQVERSARVALLGSATSEALFQSEDPVDKQIKIDGINFRVVGVLESKGDQGWNNPDDQAIVPYTTAMNQLFGLGYLHELNLQIVAAGMIPKVQEGIETVLRKRHRIQAGQPDDFHVRNQAEMLESASGVARTFSMLLGGVGSIGLLVGGIGIMNIMLVTVTERTREIGIRKAIGARNRDILRQFLIEAILMSGIGGLLGAGLGVGLAHVLSESLDFPSRVEPAAVILGFGFSAAVGVFFGYYPARRAARLEPIVCLRYE